MKWVSWTLQILLALAFAGAGVGKLTTLKAELEQRMAWATDFSQLRIQAIGAAEVAGAPAGSNFMTPGDRFAARDVAGTRQER